MRKQFLFGMVLASLLGTANAATVFSENFQGAPVAFQGAAGPITGTLFSLLAGSIDINGVPNNPGGANDGYGRLCSGFFTDSTQQCLDTMGGGGGPRGDFESTSAINFVVGVQYTLSFVLYQWNADRNGTQPPVSGGINTMLRVRVGLSGLFDMIYDSSLCAAAACVITANFTPVAANAGLQRLRFTDNGPGTGFAGAILDDVTIQSAIPEPATFALVGLGVAALAFARRKRA